MLKIKIVDKLSERALQDHIESLRLISMRQLTQVEVALARARGLRWYCLPSLGQKNVQEFYEKFDAFWDGVVQPFSEDHCFWRNPVSSKMQEWERSLAYFALILFTLSQESYIDKDLHLIFICASLQEEDVLRAWAKKYSWLITYGKDSSFRWFRIFIQKVKNSVRFAKFLVLCFYRKFMAFRTRVNVSDDDRRPNILIASLFYNQSFREGKYNDPFFGAFHEYLEKNKFRYLYLCDSLDWPNFELKRDMSQCHSSELIMPYSLLSLSKLIIILLRVFFRKFHFAKCKFMDVNFSGVMLWNAHRFSDYWSINAEIIFEATKQLCQQRIFNKFLYIYEGNVFERACIQAFRQFSSGEIIGYSHGTLDRLNLKLRLTANEVLTKPGPDRYVCTGEYTKKRLAEIGSRNVVKMSAGCSLRSIPFTSCSQVQRKTAQQILVALDGMQTSVVMLDWLFEHAEIFSNFRILIRAHPNVPFEKLKRQCLCPMPEHLVISSGDLKGDLENSFCVVYRQSSIGIQALTNGIFAIHLAVDLPLSGDPIEELMTGRWIAKTPQELRAAFEAARSLNGQDCQVLLQEEKVFAENYFLSPTEDRLRDFIGSKIGR
ncbi:MAG: hypothetical protein V1739_08485 [Candidatus Omnitrophota bacterium]